MWGLIAFVFIIVSSPDRDQALGVPSLTTHLPRCGRTTRARIAPSCRRAGASARERSEGSDHCRWRLHEFDQYALAAARGFRAGPGMQEAHVVSGGTLADATGSEAHALLAEPAVCSRQIVHPQSEMIQCRFVNFGTLVRVERLHQIQFDEGGATPELQDRLSHVFARTLELATDFEP